MINIGMQIKVKYPEYARDLIGVIVAQELDSSRWIIEVKPNPFKSQRESLFLSLAKSDFEVVEFLN